jgi:leucyl-tRNA synthetase
MSHTFDPSATEAKWQKKWEDAKVYEVDLAKAKKPYYTHVMFPYPSGDRLHVGHWYNYSGADMYARHKKMQGHDVFSPMGFDAFGLPAENYAIKTGTPPAESTGKNVETMIKQLKRIGCMYDWNHMVNSSHPEYYKWTQWLFLQMHKNDLAYKKEAVVNWCNSCNTVLANEQVWDGLCERCESEVIQKPLEQWFWGITKYADKLIDNLNDLDWPEKTKIMQKNWIGRKEGINIIYEVENCDEKITCFTTRPDTNFGATFIVLSPEHPFAQSIASGELPSDNKEDVQKYVEAAANKTELQRLEEGKKKTGTFTGYNAINNLNGKKLPVWVGDFVLSTVGTGAVVGVPGHDTRDFEFAQQFDIPVIRVVIAPGEDNSPIGHIKQVQEAEGTMVNSEFLDGLPIMEAKEKIKDHLEENGWGKRVITYRLRDWLVSRQRYWGAPIPIVYDPEGKPHPIPEEHLPWLLPTDIEFDPTGKSPMADSKELQARTEKIFGKGWKPELDTMDTFVCSSFYSFMYPGADHSSGEYKQLPIKDGLLVDKKLEKKWLPVQMYCGGAEHACMHLIYARFVSMALKDMGYISHEEQYQKLVHQGFITNKGVKMSKSKGNVVSPDSFVEKYGSDVFRMYLMFMGPFTQGGDWSDTGIKGVSRFVKRIWRVFSEKMGTVKQDSPEVTQKLHATIKKVGNDIERFQLNTALSALMELFNLLEKSEGITVETAKTCALIVAPLAPHLAEEMWEHAGGKGFVIEQSWPEFDESLLVSDSFTLVVQINGRVRANVDVSADISEADAIVKAKEQENVQRFLDGKEIKKEVYVPGKLVSLVV